MQPVCLLRKSHFQPSGTNQENSPIKNPRKWKMRKSYSETPIYPCCFRPRDTHTALSDRGVNFQAQYHKVICSYASYDFVAPYSLRLSGEVRYRSHVRWQRPSSFVRFYEPWAPHIGGLGRFAWDPDVRDSFAFCTVRGKGSVQDMCITEKSP